MIDLSTSFAGISLKSPIIVSSSGLSNSLGRIEKMAKAGAGAVVLKSLFEEQIRHETGLLMEENDYPEAVDYLKAYARENSLDLYLNHIQEAKAAVDIPVIASINCSTSAEWTDFAARIESAGADALELNIYFLPIDRDRDSGRYEKDYLDLAGAVCKQSSIPVIVKLGSGFTNVCWMANQLYMRGAAGLVLFNRFYTPDIRMKDLSFVSSEVLSSPADLRLSLRWIGIVSSQVSEIDLAASTGVHNGHAALKQILAGASAVQVCSVLYRNGIEYIHDILAEMREWMEKQGHESLSDFRGSMNYASLKDPSVYERAQFIKYFSRMS
ncbi:MAG: diguanylate cyclase [Bacteroidetes bacterium]|nr:MAG: diguanylate cyclase [Bacteroidota bacterium]